MWLDTKTGWSVDEDWEIDHWEMSAEELAESDRLRDEALKVLATTSLDPAAWDWPDLALLESDECRLN